MSKNKRDEIAELYRHALAYYDNRIHCIRTHLDALTQDVERSLTNAEFNNSTTRINQRKKAEDILQFSKELVDLIDKFSFLDYLVFDAPAAEAGALDLDDEEEE